MNNERLCDHTLFMRSILVFSVQYPPGVWGYAEQRAFRLLMLWKQKNPKATVKELCAAFEVGLLQSLSSL